MSQKDGDRRNENTCQGLMENEGKNIENIFVRGNFFKDEDLQKLIYIFLFLFF